nr:hypothetical protein GCM10020093_056010 [Planobispora longispora]
MTTAQKLSFDVQLSDHARTSAEREQVLASPGFGQVFTDHMISIDYTEGRGWHDARLMPYGPLSLDPATSVFHYAQELFEGLKAYRQGAARSRRSGRTPTPPASTSPRRAWPCPSCPRRRSSSRWSCSSRPIGSGCPRPRGTASTCAPS